MSDTTSNTSNPLLARVRLPGRTFQLPSRGAIYSNGELDASIKDGEVHVHPMSALTEISLKNPDLLFNGKALQAVFNECVPGIKKPLELFGRDVDALLFYLRMVTYGNEFRVEVKHECAEAKQHSYTVDLEQLSQKMKQLDPTLLETRRTVKLANGQSVYTRPMKFADIVALFHRSAGKKELSPDDIKDLARTNLLCMIERVEDITNPTHIEEWINALTSPMMTQIIDAATALNDWGPDQIVTLKCRDCEQDMRVELPLNPVSFFTE